MKILKQNWVLICIILLIAIFSFYWWSIKPNQIRRDCYNYAAFGISDKSLLKYIDKSNALDIDNDYFQKEFNKCLYRKGIKLQ